MMFMTYIRTTLLGASGTEAERTRKAGACGLYGSSSESIEGSAREGFEDYDLYKVSLLTVDIFH